MAAGTLAAPGTDAGPCANACCHRNCALTRGEASALCVYCGMAIGYDRRFYREGNALAHATCSEKAQARQ